LHQFAEPAAAALANSHARAQVQALAEDLAAADRDRVEAPVRGPLVEQRMAAGSLADMVAIVPDEP
jgi:hypothetical protein